MLAFFPTDQAAAMTVQQQWIVAIVMSAAIPGLVAPVVIWRIQTLMDALDAANAELARLAATDQLTGLLNAAASRKRLNASQGSERQRRAGRGAHVRHRPFQEDQRHLRP